MTRREDKTERIEIRVRPADKAAIEKVAERHGLTASEYIRAACLAQLAKEIDPHALRALASGLGDSIRDAAISA